MNEIVEKHIWDEFISRVAPPTFLHSWEWGMFQEKSGTPVIRFGVWEGERLVGVSLILKIRAKRGRFLFCPHGPVLDPHYIDSNSYSLIVKLLTERLTAVATSEGFDFIRLAPIVPDTPEHRQPFTSLGYRSAPIHMHPELAWILDLEPTEEDLMKAMRKTTRYSIRKAESDGVAVSVGHAANDLDAFWTVYGATVKRQHFTPFSKAYLTTELETFSANGSAEIFIGSISGEPVSAAFVVFDAHSAYYHHGASTQAYPKIPASHLVLWRAITEAKRRGCRQFNFWGISPEDQPKHPWAGLSLFKKGFGGRAEAYVHAQDFIIKPFYWIDWSIEMIRRKMRRL